MAEREETSSPSSLNGGVTAPPTRRPVLETAQTGTRPPHTPEHTQVGNGEQWQLAPASPRHHRCPDGGGSGGGGGDDGTDTGEAESAPAGLNAVENVVDGPWAWVVTVATFVIHFILYGFIFVSGMYFVVFLKTFRRSSSDTSWIASLYLGTMCATGPVAGSLINRLGCRTVLLLGALFSTLGQVTSAFASGVVSMYFTFGILIGFGHGLFLMGAIVALNQYFKKYRVMALGISLVGTAAGNIIYPHLTRYLITTHGWRGALIYSAGINIHCCVAAMFVRPLPNSATHVSANQKLANNGHRKAPCQTTTELCKDVHYWLLCASNATFVFGMSMFITHIAAFAQSVGLGETRIDHLLSSLGIAALVGRGGTALVAQHKRVDIILFLVFCYVIAGVAMVFYGVNRTFVGLLVSVLVYGLFSSTNGSVSAEYASHVIGSGAFATGYGNVMFCNSVGAVAGAPVAGWLYDRTGVYPASFYLSGSCMVLSGLLMFPTYIAYCHRAPASEGATSSQLAEKPLTEGELDGLSAVCEV